MPSRRQARPADSARRLKGQGLFGGRRRFEGKAGLPVEGFDEVGPALAAAEAAAD